MSSYHNFPYSYKMTIAYDGAAYCGWQRQPHGTSIQETIEEKLNTILPEKPQLIGSGRTDAGVHAKAQVAHFRTHSLLDTDKIQHSLNSLLPKEIRILELQETDALFHARYSAKGKVYHYHLAKKHDPFERRYRLFVGRPLNLDLLRQGADHFLGTHDFTSFANVGSAGTKNGAVRTIHRIDVVEEPQGLRLEFEGTGFLYKMVRNLVGTLLDVASGKLAPEKIPEILAAKDRRRAQKAAAAHGLFLVEVLY